MANNITGNPVYIDTAGTLFKQRFKFDGGIWNNAAAADTLVLMDTAGRVVLSATFPTDLQPVEIPKMGWVNGLICTTISGGNVTIYVGNK
ncbi:MAG TPA: hypothetical protein VGF75_08040 [Candidatus Saccharimonadales bacterium]|jgi:hypothetical protein